ncbi:hypothetical protein ACM66B_004924 [Microbotryomycetes sp. NB124-2]
MNQARLQQPSSPKLHTRRPPPRFQHLIDLNSRSTFTLGAIELEPKDVQRPFSSPLKPSSVGTVSGVEESVEIRSKMPWSRRKDAKEAKMTDGGRESNAQQSKIIDFDELQERHRHKLRKRVLMPRSSHRMQRLATNSKSAHPEWGFNNMHTNAEQTPKENLSGEGQRGWTRKLLNKLKMTSDKLKPSRTLAKNHDNKANKVPSPESRNSVTKDTRTGKRQHYIQRKPVPVHDESEDDEDWNHLARGRRLKQRHPGRPGRVKFSSDDEDDEVVALLGLSWLDYKV